MRSFQDMIRQEVIYCVSGLINDLAQGAGYDEGHPVNDVCYDALEACAPVLDYEKAAREMGWVFSSASDLWVKPEDNYEAWDTAEEVCDAESIEPRERKIFEHWIVTDWLADKLEDKGERIVRDLAGLTVWGRTTTKQTINMDSVIEDIYRDTHK